MELKKLIDNTIIEFLNESAELDIKFNNESKRIYNKIKNNIKNIKFIPTPNDDGSEFVKDTKGNIHFLKGVKFNLNQLEKKYDLDILLVNRIGKNSNHHYDQNANRLVFFIIPQTSDPLDFENNSYLARLKFNSLIDENLFIHEFIHFLDGNRYGDTYSFSEPKNDNEYYNSPEEYNAYSQEIIKQLIKNKSKLKDLPFEIFLNKTLKFGREEFIFNLNDEYMKKLKNRLYKLYSELNSVEKK
jgi:hypothetical protein